MQPLRAVRCATRTVSRTLYTVSGNTLKDCSVSRRMKKPFTFFVLRLCIPPFLLYAVS